MGEPSYDAIVIGAGIGGLGVSGLLARAGLRVLTLERAPAIGGRASSFEYRGHVLNVGGPRVGLEGGRADALFAELGAEPSERAFFDRIVTHRRGRFVELGELAAKAPREEQLRFERALEGASEGGLSSYDDLSAMEYLSAQVESQELRDVARCLSTAMCSLPQLEDMAASALIAALRTVQRRHRTYLSVKGPGDSMRILAEAVRKHGGELETNARVNKLLMEGERVSGVAARVGAGVDGRQRRFFAPLVVAAFPVWELLELVPEDFLAPEFEARLEHLDRTTAVFGITAALREPLHSEKYLLLTDASRAGHPMAGYLASNLAPSLSPEGEHRLELSCICESGLGDDRAGLRAKIELMRADVDELYPGWEDSAIWVKPHFHWVGAARTPGREGVHRPGPRAPGVEGLYFAGDTVSSRALPGFEAAAESAMICARAILGET